MLVIPIKKKWFDRIAAGEKKEEYREIKPYYTSRFVKALGFPEGEREEVQELLRQMPSQKKITVLFRNGYTADSPAFVADCSLSIGEGKPEWGAESGKQYYRLRIDSVVFAIMDNMQPGRKKIL